MFSVGNLWIPNEFNVLTTNMSRLINNASSSLEMVAQQCSLTVTSFFESAKAKSSEEKFSQDDEEKVIWFLPQEEFQDSSSSILSTTPCSVIVSSDDSFVKSTYEEEEVTCLVVYNVFDVLFMQSFAFINDSSSLFFDLFENMITIHIVYQRLMYIFVDYNLYSQLIYHIFKTPKQKVYSFVLFS